ncbi:hypothetical protein, partial [Micromonospora sp.]|uniref:hypothetical protein n=1 Tax=Micromonospora sp. TaxID=1876 RepID=UPI003B3BCCA2
MPAGQLPVLAEAPADAGADADRLLSTAPLSSGLGVPEPVRLGVGSAVLVGVGVGGAEVTGGLGVVGGFVGPVVGPPVGRG